MHEGPTWRHKVPDGEVKKPDVDHGHEHIMAQVRAEEAKIGNIQKHTGEGVWDELALSKGPLQ